MVGIVLVSHSYALAEGAKELALTMAGPEVKIAAAGGLDMDDHPIGTDPMRILQAIQEVYSDEGVLIFVDMGSALLSSDLALQFLDEDQQKQVVVSDAPFIEGAVTAAVQARMHNSLPEIMQELKYALQPKQEQLGTSSAEAENASGEDLDQGQDLQPDLAADLPADQSGQGSPDAALADGGDEFPGLKLRLQLKNKAGLHARPAAKIASLAASYPGLKIQLRKIPSSKAPANCRSLNSLTLLGLRQDEVIEFAFLGEGAAEAREAMRALAAEGFGDGSPEAALELDQEAPLEAQDAYLNKAQLKASRPAASQPDMSSWSEPSLGAGYKAAAATGEPQVGESIELKKELPGLCASPGIAAGPAFFRQNPQAALEAKIASLVATAGSQDLPAGLAGSQPEPASKIQSENTAGTQANSNNGMKAQVDPVAEGKTFQAALAACKEKLKEEKAQITQVSGPKAAAIFDAHLLILEDPLVEAEIKQKLDQEGQTAAKAWNEVMQDLERSYQQSDSPVIRERAADIRDLRWRLLRVMFPELAEKDQVGAGILLAEELGPGEAAQLDADQVLGICTAKGSPSSHAAVIARSRGIPAVMGLGPDLLRIKPGTALLLDAEAGKLYLDPAPALQQELMARKEREAQEAAAAASLRHLPAVTASGRHIEVFANIGSVDDARAAVDQGAEGVGLLRTEFIFLHRTSAPGEEEQLAIYREISQALDGRPLTLRTLDAGGDKPVPYLHLPPESNPFLGYRAIRICLKEPEFFRTQLRAVLRTACDYPVRIMFPMIASLSELRAAKAQLALAQEELRQRGLPVPEKVPVGMMIEIPSAALLAEDFAREVDFFSIGTNDLTQYTLAAERGNQQLADLYSPLHPAVLELIRVTVEGAHKAGIPTAVCGEFAADPQGAKALVDLGVDELSVNPISIPAVKQRVRSLA